MTISIFDGSEDAYGWVLCTENYFKRWGTPETEKMVVAAMAMKGPALTWWLWWSRCHPHTSWDPFTTAFLWRFKSEYRDILPFSDEEEEPFTFTHSFYFSSPLPGSATINPFPVMAISPLAPILHISILPPPKPTVADNTTITSFNCFSPRLVLTTHSPYFSHPKLSPGTTVHSVFSLSSPSAFTESPSKLQHRYESRSQPPMDGTTQQILLKAIHSL